ncbi:MAG: PqqD family protein [Bacillota bacterium]|nr:PqqD family protein [Bacillota bacterium]
MKLKHTFEIMELDDECVAVPILESANEIHGVIKLNDTGVEIFTALEDETSEEEIVSKLAEKYNETSKEEIASFVHEFLEGLCEAGLVE